MYLISFKEFLQEARRNPHLNPKTSVYKELEPYLRDPNAFISFTTIDKIGINPSSRYQTPLGLYTYPIVAAFDYYSVDPKRDLNDQLPFAAEAPFFWILSAKRPKKLLYLNDVQYRQSHYVKDIKIFERYYTNTTTEDKVGYSFNEFIEECEVQARHKSFAGKIWNITRCVAADWDPSAKRNNHVHWNYVFREVLGYDGAIDNTGLGIIHPSEEVQAVFFSKGAIRVLKKVDNKPVSTQEILQWPYTDNNPTEDSITFWVEKVEIESHLSIEVPKLFQMKANEKFIEEMIRRYPAEVLAYGYEHISAKHIKMTSETIRQQYYVDWSLVASMSSVMSQSFLNELSKNLMEHPGFVSGFIGSPYFAGENKIKPDYLAKMLDTTVSLNAPQTRVKEITKKLYDGLKTQGAIDKAQKVAAKITF